MKYNIKSVTIKQVPNVLGVLALDVPQPCTAFLVLLTLRRARGCSGPLQHIALLLEFYNVVAVDCHLDLFLELGVLGAQVLLPDIIGGAD